MNDENLLKNSSEDESHTGQQQVVHALEAYFRETSLTQQMPLPRWAMW